MKISERDELLIRMDERQRQIKEEDLPEINSHLKTLNGHLDDHSKRQGCRWNIRVNHSRSNYSFLCWASIELVVKQLV